MGLVQRIPAWAPTISPTRCLKIDHFFGLLRARGARDIPTILTAIAGAILLAHWKVSTRLVAGAALVGAVTRGVR